MLRRKSWRLLGGLFAFRAAAATDGQNDQALTAWREPDMDEKLRQELAGLSPEAREQRLQVRQRYEQFARRQRLVEVEEQADGLRRR